MMKNSLYIFGTRCDAITTLQNLKFRFHLSVEKQKRQIVLGVNWTKEHSLGRKLNEELVEGVIQTLAILEGSNLDFFLDSLSLMEWVSKILLKEQVAKDRTKGA